MENKPEKETDDNKNLITISILVILLVFGLWLLTLYTLKDKLHEDRGTFGDMFGGVNALFSGLAFGGIIITILLQRKELALQRQELTDTRIELKRSADAQDRSERALAAQVEKMEKQQFESAFFNLLQLHAEIVKNIDLSKTISRGGGTKPTTTETQIIHGRDCFQIFYQTLSTTFHMNKNRASLEEIYYSFYSAHQNDLGHYFRSLYHIVKFVHLSDVGDKKRYTSILRAQLSSHQLLMLFYNGSSKLGEKFKPLIKEYDLLKNLSKADLLNQDHLNLYR